MLDDIVGLIYIAVLIALTAFFVVSEFAIVKVRTSKIEEHIEKGRKSAIAAKKSLPTWMNIYLPVNLGLPLPHLESVG